MTMATTVADLMEPEVTTVPPEMSVRELTRILADQGISGAPVVTPQGSLLGVVSSTDIVRVAAEESELRVASARWVPMPAWEEPEQFDPTEGDDLDVMGSYFLPEEGPALSPAWGEEIGDGAFDELTVGDIMTPVTFSIGPDATVRELASFLLRGRIHRAVVTDDGQLVGIVTAMDVLRAVSEEKPL